MYYCDKLLYRDKYIMIIDTVIKTLSHITNCVCVCVCVCVCARAHAHAYKSTPHLLFLTN